MSLLDLMIILIAEIIFYFAHTPLGLTVILTTVVLIVVRLVKGERVP
jgi:hypothetical protein